MPLVEDQRNICKKAGGIIEIVLMQKTVILLYPDGQQRVREKMAWIVGDARKVNIAKKPVKHEKHIQTLQTTINEIEEI